MWSLGWTSLGEIMIAWNLRSETRSHMSGIESLIEGFESGSLLRPSCDRPNLVDLSRAMAALSGVHGLDLSPSAQAIAASVGDAEHIVLVMADGVGIDLLSSQPRNSFLQRHLQDELLTVFPSTTSVALTSLTTGRWPAEHAVTGWWTHLPDIASAAAIIKYTARSNDRDLLAQGVDPDRSFPVRSIWADIPRDVRIIVPRPITGSVYSKYFGGGRETVGYRSLQEGVDMTVRHVLDSCEDTFTYLYVPRVDSLAHLHGITRPEVRHALTEVDNEMSRLYSAVGSKARIVVTADHGFLDAPAPNRHTVRPSRELRPLLRFPPSGDARVMYLHTWDWARERVRRYFERRFGDKFILVTIDEAVNLDLFGPVAPTDQTRERLGDLMAVSSGADVLEYNAARGAGRMVQLNAHHSGLSPQEMLIPLVVV